MSPRTLRVTILALVLVALLFAGRWTAGLLAERWWAAQLSPGAARFVTRWTLMSLGLELLGVATACCWFIANLLLIYRAIGSVQVHRRLANLEIREAVNMRAIIWLSVGGGLLSGFVTGRGAGNWTGALLMGWTGLQYGEVDPLLGRELGFYLTRLPVWRLFHGYMTLLTVSALGGAVILYAVIGALRWVDRRPAINDHARRHLGILASLLALALAWGYLLEPYELVGGLNGSVNEGLFDFRQTVALVLTGTAIAAMLLSFLWAIRGQNTVLLAVWALLAAASVLGHYVIPALIGSSAASVIENSTRRQLDQLAYGMTAARDSALLSHGASPDPPRPTALWHPTLAAEATVGDSGVVVATDRAVVMVGGRPRPAWIVVRDQDRHGASITVMLDDQTTATGQPILFHDADSLRTPKGAPALRLPPRGSWPRGAVSVVDTMPGGPLVGSGLRRLALAWALQSGRLLGPGAAGQRVYWHLDPVERLTTLAPFATWGAPAPRFIGGELVWLVDGYLASGAFPGSSRVRWRGEWVGTLRAGFIGVIHAETGATTIYLRHTADEVAKQWRTLTDSLVQPASALPPEVVRALPYPAELLEAQVRVLSASHWDLGQVIGRPEPIGVTGPSDDGMWQSDTSGVQQVVPYQRPQQRQIAAIVRSHSADGWEVLSILRVDSLLSLPDPTSLQSKWGRFATFQQLKDSVEREGARLESGPIRYWPTSVGLGAYQPSFARRDGQEPAVVWVSLAIGERRGAGHDAEEAWQNLLGLSAPVISAGERGSQLFEARRHIQAADAALKRGDLEAFGRAWEALKRALRTP